LCSLAVGQRIYYQGAMKSAKLSKSSSILKVRSQDGKFIKKTNFSKDQWDKISDMYMCDILIIGPDY